MNISRQSHPTCIAVLATLPAVSKGQCRHAASAAVHKAHESMAAVSSTCTLASSGACFPCRPIRRASCRKARERKACMYKGRGLLQRPSNVRILDFIVQHMALTMPLPASHVRCAMRQGYSQADQVDKACVPRMGMCGGRSERQHTID